MKKPIMRISISMEDDVTNPEQAPIGEPVVNSKPGDVTEITGQKPIEKLGQDGIQETPKPLAKDENSFETAIGGPKGQDNMTAKGVPTVAQAAKEGAKGGVPEMPGQITPSTEDADTTTNGGVGEQGEGVTAEPSGVPAKATEIVAPKSNEVKEIEINQAMSVEPDVCAEIDMTMAQADVDFDQEQREEAAIQSLEVTQATVQELVDTGTGTEATLKLIEEATVPALEALGIQLLKPSMEQYGKLSITQKHEVALESLGGALKTYAQWRTTAEAKSWNSLFDMFKSTQGEIAKYEKVLKAEKANQQTRVGAGKEKDGSGKLDLTTLWQFFSTGAGQVPNIADATKRDVLADREILVNHSGKVMNQLKKLDSILRQVPTNIEGFKKLLHQVETLTPAAVDFPKQLLTNNHPLLGVKGLEVRYGSARSAVEVEGESFAKLAQLATATDVKMVGSLKHGAKKFVASGTIADTMISNKIDMKDGDVTAVLDGGLMYLANAQEYIKHKDEVAALMKSIDAGLAKVGVVVKGLGNDQLAGAMTQVAQVAKNLLRGYQSPAANEVSRAITGAKFCWHAARAMRTFAQ